MASLFHEKTGGFIRRFLVFLYRFFSYRVPSAIFIISVNFFSLSSAVVISGATKLSEIVSRQAAFFPSTFALWNKAKLSISTQQQ